MAWPSNVMRRETTRFSREKSRAGTSLPRSDGGGRAPALKGRRVLADQMEYLVAHFPRSSPLHQRLKRK